MLPFFGCCVMFEMECSSCKKLVKLYTYLYGRCVCMSCEFSERVWSELNERPDGTNPSKEQLGR